MRTHQVHSSHKEIRFFENSVIQVALDILALHMTVVLLARLAVTRVPRRWMSETARRHYYCGVSDGEGAEKEEKRTNGDKNDTPAEVHRKIEPYTTNKLGKVLLHPLGQIKLRLQVVDGDGGPVPGVPHSRPRTISSSFNIPDR